MATAGIIALAIGTSGCGDSGKDKKTEPALSASNMDTTIKAVNRLLPKSSTST